MPDTEQESDTYSDAETKARAESTLKRMLPTPHKPHKPIKERCKPAEKPR